MSEQKITEIEEKMAYQEDAIKILNDEVYQQQRRIDSLESICKRLLDRMKGLDEPGGMAGEGESDNQPPPHY